MDKIKPTVGTACGQCTSSSCNQVECASNDYHDPVKKAELDRRCHELTHPSTNQTTTS